MPSQYGKFYNFCRDSGSRHATIPVCNLFNESPARVGANAIGFGGCDLIGIKLKNGNDLANLGSILFSVIAILVALFLIWRSELKKAAVGRREMQIFLAGYLLISLCEIFTVGGIPLHGAVIRGFTAIHIAAVVSTTWILLLNGVVGYQLLEDGTAMSIGLIAASGVIIFIGSGYIALATGFSFNSYWTKSLDAPNLHYPLYTIYQLAPLVFLVLFFLLESFLVLRILGELRPLLYLLGAALFFILGQIFQYVVSVHICNGTHGKINGGMFEVFFTIFAVVMVWGFWSSITEDDWPTTTGYS